MFFKLSKTFALRINLLLAVIGGSITLWRLSREPSEAQAAILLGFSLPRLLILLVIILVLLVSVFLFLRSLRDDFWTSRIGEALRDAFMGTWLPALLLVLSLALYFSLFMTDQMLGSLASYRGRLYPLLIWFALLIVQGFITIFAIRWFYIPTAQSFRGGPVGFLAAFGMLGTLVLLISLSRIGLTPDSVYWQDPGAPLLIQQVIAAFVVGAGFSFFQKRIGSLIKHAPLFVQNLFSREIVICLIIWGLASALWLAQPLRPSYNSLPPKPPNFQSYPFGDAMYYDIHAQSFLIGKPIPSHFWVKPLYTFFLSILHIIVGQDYLLLISLQVVILAIIPVLGYLIVRTIGNRAAGLVMALLIIFRERNAIALSNVIQVSHSKLLLSDVFSMGLMALLTLLLVQWCKSPKKKPWLPLAFGGILGFLVLTRGHPILIFPFLSVFILYVLFSQGKLYLWRKALLLLTIGFILPLIPWFFRNYQLTGKVTLQDAPEAYIGQLANLYSSNPSTSYGAQISSDFINSNQVADTQAQIFKYVVQHPGDVLQFVSAHYFHNLIYSYLYLPHAVQVLDVRSLVKFMPFWEEWDGYLPDQAKVMLLLNLGVLALGFSTLWRKNKLFVFVPLLLMLTYDLSISVGRLSGWRFILPFDWLMLVFYSLGLEKIITITTFVFMGQQGQEQEELLHRKDSVPNNWIPLLLTLMFVFTGMGVTMGNQAFQTDSKRAQSWASLVQDIPDSHVALDVQSLKKFTQDDRAKVIYGRALFPIYLPSAAGFQSVFAPSFDNQPFGRLAFYLIGDQKISGFIQLDSAIKEFPSAQNIMLFGCYMEGRYGDYIDALVIILDTDPPSIYVRSTIPESLTCPLNDTGIQSEDLR